jgi:hypothetical protein
MTYAELIALTSSWADRADAASLNATFIPMAEGEMAFLRTRQFVDLPPDFLAERSLRLADIDVDLQFITPDAIDQLVAYSGRPQFYTIIAGQIRLHPAPDTTYAAKLTYYQSITPFTEEATNWIATEFPNAYRFGLLWACAMWRKDNDDIALYRGQFDNALSAIQSRFADRTGKMLRADDTIMQAGHIGPYRYGVLA